MKVLIIGSLVSITIFSGLLLAGPKVKESRYTLVCGYLPDKLCMINACKGASIKKGLCAHKIEEIQNEVKMTRGGLFLRRAAKCHVRFRCLPPDDMVRIYVSDKFNCATFSGKGCKEFLVKASILKAANECRDEGLKLTSNEVVSEKYTMDGGDRFLKIHLNYRCG